MQIYIDNKLAVMKKGTAFDFVSENPLFTGAESYSLSISLPLKGCAENIAIFGHINRDDVLTGRVLIDGAIVDRNLTRHGTFAITEISDIEVKVQFLEGRSAQNYQSTFDKIYINELDLGEQPTIDKKDLRPWQAWEVNTAKDIDGGVKCVALPWALKNSTNVNYDCGNTVYWTQVSYNNWKWGWDWREDLPRLTWQPFLIFIAKQVCRAVGYSYDFNKWETNENLKYLLVCNTLPPAYGLTNFARALPHWTVEEFFDQLEKFMGGDFSIDHKAKTVTFNYWKDVLKSAGQIQITSIIGEHTVSLTLENSDCEYLGVRNIKYKDNGADDWQFYCCPDFVNIYKSYFENSDETERGDRVPILTFNTFEELTVVTQNLHTIHSEKGDAVAYDKKRHRAIDALLYVREADQYFILYEFERSGNEGFFTQKFDLLPLNIWGPRNVSKINDSETTELSIVPAVLARTKEPILSLCQRRRLILEPKSLDSEMERIIRGFKISDLLSWHATPRGRNRLWRNKTTKLKRPNITIRYSWGGMTDHAFNLASIKRVTHKKTGLPYYLPYPNVSEYDFPENLDTCRQLGFSLRLNAESWLERSGLMQIEPNSKSTFQFLADSIPSPRAIFNIRGKRYLCAKITATFTENGMSQLLTGEFYPLAETSR